MDEFYLEEINMPLQVDPAHEDNRTTPTKDEYGETMAYGKLK